MKLKLMFEPRDMWVGVFWCWRYDDAGTWITRCPDSPVDYTPRKSAQFLTLYICILPCFPLRVEIGR